MRYLVLGRTRRHHVPSIVWYGIDPLNAAHAAIEHARKHELGTFVLCLDVDEATGWPSLRMVGAVSYQGFNSTLTPPPDEEFPPPFDPPVEGDQR